ncbi:MAG: AMP-binding protein, partial [Bifidobacteriaceae bacterium]|nr:AMP-binding protein [Bifidobacteriaceae bacterium]
WLSAYPPGVPADVPEPTDPLHVALEQAALVYPNRPALDFFGRRTTYAQLWDQVLVAAQALADRGVGRGSVVALALPNCPQHVVAFYAVARLGGIVVEHNPTYGAAQFAEQLADCGAGHVIVWDKVAATVASVVDQGQVDVIAVNMAAAMPLPQRLALHAPIPKARRLRRELTGKVGAGIVRWENLMRGQSRLDDAVQGPAVGDVAALQYTGGTTGTPKGAILTHANLAVNATQSVAWVPGLVRGEEVFYGALPFFHAFGLTLCLTVPVRVGGLLVIFPKFSVGLVVAAQRRIPGTFFPGVAPMFERLVDAAARSKRTRRAIDLTSFRHSISGAMAIPQQVAQRWEDATGGMLIEGYGLTETSPIAVGNPASEYRRPGTLGLPFPNTHIRIADLERPEHDATPGESGELWIRGPQVFAGYWNRPEETAQCLTSDGWFRTGDVVVRDPDGLVRLVDRIKEVIITGGFNVYPSQVEDRLALMPEIAEVAVVGIPQGDLGERVVAAVVLRASAKLDLAQARAWCLDHLARYAIPKQLVLMTELPRSQVGKVLRRVVKHQILAAKAASQ